MEEKLEVIIKHYGDEKYIVLDVVEKGEEKKVLVSMALPWHKDIFYAYQEQRNWEVDVKKVMGGGRLYIHKGKKVIRTHGYSGSYGHADEETVKKILEKEFPDYYLDIDC